MPLEEFDQKRTAADLAFFRQGTTFNVYGHAQRTERILPFELVPRTIQATDLLKEMIAC